MGVLRLLSKPRGGNTRSIKKGVSLEVQTCLKRSIGKVVAQENSKRLRLGKKDWRKPGESISGVDVNEVERKCTAWVRELTKARVLFDKKKRGPGQSRSGLDSRNALKKKRSESCHGTRGRDHLKGEQMDAV